MHLYALGKGRAAAHTLFHFIPMTSLRRAYVTPWFTDRTTEAHRSRCLAEGDTSTKGQSRDVNAAPRESRSSAAPHTIEETKAVTSFSPVGIPTDTQFDAEQSSTATHAHVLVRTTCVFSQLLKDRTKSHH